MSETAQQVALPPRIKGVKAGSAPLEEATGRVLSTRLADLDRLLPEGGLPLGAVIEVTSPYGLGRATSVALGACAAAQAEAKLRGGEEAAAAWCAWVEPMGVGLPSNDAPGAHPPPLLPGGQRAQPRDPAFASLFAPAAERAGVDLSRLLVVRPDLDTLAQTALRLAASRVFSVVVIDLAGVPGRRQRPRLDRWVNPVRRLAIAVEGAECSVVLLTDSLIPRSFPLPVALRLELDRAAEDRLSVTVAKDRRGRVSSPKPLALGRPPSSPGLERSA